MKLLVTVLRNKVTVFSDEETNVEIVVVNFDLRGWTNLSRRIKTRVRKVACFLSAQVPTFCPEDVTYYYNSWNEFTKATEDKA
jgi:hypothetical protein